MRRSKTIIGTPEESAQIVLIQPLTGSWDEMSTRLPESLLAVASVPVAKGYDVRIIDQRITTDFEATLDKAIGPETVIIGITAITGEQIRHALQVTRLVKSRYPHVPVCWGGVHATLIPEQTISHPLIDFVVVGDGEYVFCELYERLRDGVSIFDLRGILYKTVEGIRSNAGRITSITGANGHSYTYVRENGCVDIIRNLDELPSIPYHLLDLKKYSVFHTTDGKLSATLNTSRGCPYHCVFCSDPVINEGIWRGYSSSRVLEKVRYLHEHFHVRMIYFQDDYFPGPKNRFLEILEGLKAYDRSLLWSTLGIRADSLSRLTDEEFALLYRSGCHSLEIGIESGNERVLKMLNKEETLADMRSTNIRLAKYDIMVKYTLIVGFPGESRSEVLDTVNFAAELERDNPNAYCLVFNYLPIIGTPFYREALEQGLEEPQTLEQWEHMDYDSWMRHYRNWASPKMVAWLQAISLVSYFHNSNVRYKFSGSPLLRLAFFLYHPIAAWRFRNNFYGCFIEMPLKKYVLALKQIIANRTSAPGSISQDTYQNRC